MEGYLRRERRGSLLGLAQWSTSYYVIDRTPNGDYLKHAPDERMAFFEGSYPLSTGEVSDVVLLSERSLAIVFDRESDQLTLTLHTRPADGHISSWFVALQQYAPVDD